MQQAGLRRQSYVSTNPYIQGALDDFRMINDTESGVRERMVRDMDFRSGNQWPGSSKTERLQDGRPSQTINRIPQFLHQVTNQLRAARLSVQVNPENSQAAVETAQALQDVMRSIERNCDADVAYATAADHMVTMGRGYWRLYTRYAEEDGFEQEIVIARIPNPLTVFMDPTGIMLDGSDARFAFIIEDIPKHEFKRRFGEAAMNDWLAFNTSGNRAPEWMPEGKCRVAEHYYKVYSKEEIVQVAIPDPNTGQVVTHDIPTDALPEGGKRLPPSWKIMQRREVEHVQVKWATITPTTVLEGNENKTEGRDFPSKYIPIVQILGEEVNVNGQVDYRGMVRDAIDPQIQYNFWNNAATEQIALAPRAPYIGYAGQFKGFEGKWNMANRKSYAYLEVVPFTIGGQPAPLPQRQQYNPAIDSIVKMFNLADNDMKAVMGLYDPSLGASGPEQSGRAILARQQQGEVANSNYTYNYKLGLRHTGRIMLDMIPRVMSPSKILRVIGEDNRSRSIMIHTGNPPSDIDAFMTEQGIEGIYDISVGRYDVSISAGVEGTKRQEAVQAMMQLIQAYPAVGPVIADMVVSNMDWPGAPEIAARIKRTMDPRILNGDPNGAPPVPPELQQQMQEMQQQLQQLQQEKQAKILQLQAEDQMQQRQIASDERIATMNNRIAVMETEAKVNAERTQQMIEIWMRGHDTQMELHTAQQDRVHERVMQREAAALAPAPASK